jgi:hypothetical protein
MRSNEQLTDHVWAALRSVPWFDRLDAEGVIADMLASGDAASYDHVMNLVPTVAKPRADRLAELLRPHAQTTGQYQGWLEWVTRFADVHQSRPLFDLMLDAVRRGDYNDRQQALWMAVYGLGRHQPAWAVELLAAWLVDRPGAFDLSESGRLPALEENEHNLVDLVAPAAERAPARYVELLVPYLLRVTASTETNTELRPIQDLHFSYRQSEAGPMPRLGDALLHGAAVALRALVEQDHGAVGPALEALADDPHDAAQWLLYEALRTDGEQFADWSAGLLLQGEYRFYCGYLSDALWTTHQLLEATSPYMPDEDFGRVEAAILTFYPSMESRQSSGYSMFRLLSGMAENRLSADGKRRLGELRRKFAVQQPSAPVDAIGGAIASPIPAAAVKHMTDVQWLKAIDTYQTDRTDFDGGAYELSQSLRIEATNDPARFANLVLKLTSETPTVYVTAVLEALGQTKQPVEPALVFAAIRHVAAWGRSENDQALSIALRRQLDENVPDDVITIILERALHAASPTADAWSQINEHGRAGFNGDIYMNAINTARGQAAITLGDLIVRDAGGHRTRLVAPSLAQLAEDPSTAVRCGVAHLLAACLRCVRDEAIAAFELLVAADDRLLATRPVVDLMIGIGTGEPGLIEPVIKRMLSSSYDDVRKAGGLLAAYAGLEFGLSQLLTDILASDDAAARAGAADLCARSLPRTTNAGTATTALLQFVTDADDAVRQAAARVAPALRNRPLRPHRELLIALIDSPTFTDSLAQLLITIKAVPDRIDDVVLQCTRRYIDVYGKQAGDIRTSAAGEAQEIAELTLRAYAQAADKATRGAILDLVDELLLSGAVGASDAVIQAER